MSRGLACNRTVEIKNSFIIQREIIRTDDHHTIQSLLPGVIGQWYWFIDVHATGSGINLHIASGKLTTGFNHLAGVFHIKRKKLTSTAHHNKPGHVIFNKIINLSVLLRIDSPLFIKYGDNGGYVTTFHAYLIIVLLFIYTNNVFKYKLKWVYPTSEMSQI